MSKNHSIENFEEVKQLEKLEKLISVNEPYTEIFDMYAMTVEKQQDIINRLQNTRQIEIDNKCWTCQKHGKKSKKHDPDRRTTQTISDQKDMDQEHTDSMAGLLIEINDKKRTIDGDLAIAQEQIDNLQRKLELQNYLIVDCQTKNDELKKQVNILEKELKITQEQLINQKLENANLKEIIDNNAQHIIQLNQDKQNLAQQKFLAEQDKNNLMERFLEEKNNMANKMNEINQLEEQMRLKMKILEENENYFQDRKNQTIQELEKSGIKLKESAPKGTMVNRSEVPTKLFRKLMKHHQSEIYQIKQTTNGTNVATCGGDKLIKFYDPLNQVHIGQFESYKSDQIYISLDFAPYTDIILAGTTDKEIQVLNYSTYKTNHTLLGHTNKVDAVSFCSEKDKCISSSSDRTIRIWDIYKGQLQQTINSGSSCRCISNFISEPMFATGHNDGSIRVYSCKSDSQKEIYHTKNVFESGVTSLQISTSGLYIIATSQDGYTVKLIDMRKSNKVVKVFENQDYFNSHECNTCCYGPNDEYVCAGSGDGEIFIWNMQTGKIKQKITNTGHEGVLIGVKYHNVTEQLFSSDSRGNFMIWY